MPERGRAAAGLTPECGALVGVRCGGRCGHEDLIAWRPAWGPPVAGRAAEAPDPADLLDEATAPLTDIADREEAFWGSLAEMVVG